MEWYYARGDEQVGPFDEAAFQQLVEEGTVTPETLVWRSGMAEWQAYGTLIAQPAQESPPVATPVADGTMGICKECGQTFPSHEMMAYGEFQVCASCKPLFIQRIKETGQIPGQFRYGGFWIRFCAKFVDGLIVGGVNFLLGLALLQLSLNLGPERSMIFIVISNVISYAIQIAYVTFFIGKYAATPGKMMCGLKVVRSDGKKVTYLRAFARYFAELLSALTLLIGYIMAAFDSEKRALHDYICDTRVVYK